MQAERRWHGVADDCCDWVYQQTTLNPEKDLLNKKVDLSFTSFIDEFNNLVGVLEFLSPFWSFESKNPVLVIQNIRLPDGNRNQPFNILLFLKRSPNALVWHKDFLRWVRKRSFKNALGLVGIPLKEASQAPGDKQDTQPHNRIKRSVLQTTVMNTL